MDGVALYKLYIMCMGKVIVQYPAIHRRVCNIGRTTSSVLTVSSCMMYYMLKTRILAVLRCLNMLHSTNNTKCEGKWEEF